MTAPPTAADPSAASAVSGHLDTRTAATEIAHELHDSIGGGCDLVVVCASFHHRAALPDALQTIRQTITPGTSLAVTAEAVLGGEREFEGVAGMTALAMRLPGVTISPWTSTPEDPIPLKQPAAIASRIHLTHDLKCTIMVGDPFSTPIARLLPAIVGCDGETRRIPVVGGMASGASQPGCNVLILDDRVFPAGVIGVSLAGAVDVDFVVSQGSRPIGTPLVVTQVRGNVITELGGRPALAVLRSVTNDLKQAERQMLNKGLLLGTVIDENKRPLGRGDFLVRNVLGFDRKSEGIAVGDVPRPGQTVQFHARDAATAAEDLQLLLDAQELKPRPFGGLLFSCNGRGQRLFGRPDHDISIIQDRLGPLPLAGFFAAGEIGPIGGTAHLHGHTAALALFRTPAAGRASATGAAGKSGQA
ncbi:MAG: hypothetical protein HKO59_09655 [Phycisphaerales bacterium]|nr:FIST C-terminal domain-containing protein [Phycisphaerae bacterium]NNF41741.1 hypothetical protein [Phycisphaerales bacterium]NNM26228.1 hypothetical protein [Phycisphaerales bacterium]